MRSLFSRVAARASEWVRSSAWARPALKLMAVLAGLVVLAKIGHTVTTATAAVGGRVPPAVAEPVGSAPVDAGADVRLLDASASNAPPPPVVHAPRATPDDPVELNRATAEDLRRLPGIGEKRAQAILELRAKLGQFRHLEELLRVKGIGRATLKKLRPLVRLDMPDGGVSPRTP